MQVPLAETTATPVGFAVALVHAWRALYGGADPTKAQAGVLWAQWMVETGGKHFYNWNIGNEKVTQAQVDADVPWFDLPGTWEIVNGTRVVLPPGDPGRRFRSYASLPDGMTSHLALLRNHRYAPSWAFVEQGDPDGFARALKRQGYYTADADAYAKLLDAMFARWTSATYHEDALAEIASDEEAAADTGSVPADPSAAQDPAPDEEDAS